MIYVRHSASFLPALLLALAIRRLFGLERKNTFIVEVNNFGSNFYRWFIFLDECLGKFDFRLIVVSEDLSRHG